MPLEEAILSASLQVVFEKLASPILREFGFQWGIHTELRKLGGTLSKIQAVVGDAEQRQIRDAAVKMWVDDLKDLAFDADDVLDEFATEALRLRLETENQENINQVWNLVPSLNPNMSTLRFSITSKIQGITEKLDDIAKERLYLGLKEGLVGHTAHEEKGKSQTGSLVDVRSIHGRKQDKEKIIDLLLSDDPARKNVSVICVAGMAGLGKTTLAQLVYNDEMLGTHFEIKAWYSVSIDFDVRRCTRAVIESVTRKECNLDNLDPLQVSLKEISSKKRFLFVLDDIWNIDQNSWSQFQAPLHLAARGSVILVTTRNNKVSLTTGAIHTYQLKALPYEYCWSLFLQCAVSGRSIDDTFSNLVAIGKKIVQRCGGLPSMVKTFGALLKSNIDEEAWNEICMSDIWELEEQTQEFLSALSLSYHYLPAHLKRCFSYCSIFPRNYEFQKEKLVLLWIAEGFVQPKGKKLLEEIGAEYFDDLLDQSFFLHSQQNDQNFVMHEVIHGLAQSVSTEICIKWDNIQFDISERARHSSFFLGQFKPTNFQALYKARRLRTFFLQRIFMFHSLPKSLNLNDMFQAFKCLRVLCFNQVSLTDLPESIGGLKHLRLLDISRTWITSLPASVNNLYNLQTLVLSECPNFQGLPIDISNLINLRHLFLPSDFQPEQMPKGMGRLTCLQTLPIFVVDKKRSGMQELRKLQHLRGSLCISKINNVRDALDVKEANLEQKHHLQELELQWDDEENENFDGTTQENVLEYLKPSQKLNKLTIKSYGGRMLPMWIRHSSLPNLIVLSLHSCIRCKVLPPLGQLSQLRHLHLKKLQNIKQIGQEFAVGGFPALETLKFEDMPNWEKWLVADGSEFCHLKSLHIKNCSKLRTFLNRFPSLITLEILNCKELTALPRLQSQGEEFPCLQDLKVENCPKLKELPQCLPELVKMELYECEELTIFPILPSLNCLSIKGLCGIQKPFTTQDFELNNLHELTIWDCSKLIQLPYYLPSLVKLDIRKCKQLTVIPGLPLPQNLEAEGNGYPSLQELVIKNCPDLKELKGNFPSLLKLETKKNSVLASLPSLPSLHKLDIDECDEILKHPFQNLKSVCSLCISRTANLISLPGTVLESLEPLEELKIANCDELSSLWEEDDQDYFTSLQRIEIWCCKKLLSLPTRLPKMLESLKLIYCWNLESLSHSLQLSYLKDLEISNNEKLISFQEVLPLTLTRLVVRECHSLKELPRGLVKLTSLQLLDIRNCPCLEYFPDEGFPVSVKWVSISGCKNLKHLPSTMRNLHSLLELRISNVPKLTILPEDGLPTTLQYLDIEGCSLLTIKCQKAGGEEWPKIAHILDKRIDGKKV